MMPSCASSRLTWSGLDSYRRCGRRPRRSRNWPSRCEPSRSPAATPAQIAPRRAPRGNARGTALIGIAAVVARGETVFDQADPAFVDAHLAARDPGLGEADETRRSLSPRAQHKGAAVHAFEPIPVLPEPGVAIGGR